MNRTRRNVVNKPFVSGGVYNPNAAAAAAAAATPVPQPVENVETTPITVKAEPATPAKSNNSREADAADQNVEMESNNGEDFEDDRIPFKKIFQKRKKSSERTRDKKLRQNRQLRKSMVPKNALMALNEVKGINISDFTINSNPDGGFTAIVTVNSVQYEGKGHSKMASKNLACEKALRDYIIARMTPRPRSTPKTATTGGDGAPEPMVTNDGEPSETPEDDVPMLNLASFAIYKLFAEWEREGFVVPEMHPSSGGNSNAQSNAQDAPAAAAAVVPKEPKKPPVRTELPASWETMHPATLLCVMRPGLSYVDHGCIGDKPNIMQCLGVIVDNQEFTANGRSKKIARRNVAVNVCNSLFNTNFTYEEY
ncbi:uncharacterized protein LOC133847974 isoform X1 [Drosophila sulfurigaster albostrigata]|uniref:uncharacterized protein LOC133847974 isoform X1 n=2 Tax=Drosophila sulfurigaster albostrigata TaxID=89887 RepID=UPI002D218E99|nr:uncharacterized protein LOC133847974 isoform X1 [Drosophila sulfurigaster albostrigata]